jgi:hypothetical protein
MPKPKQPATMDKFIFNSSHTTISPHTGKELSDQTIKLYSKVLDELASSGIKTPSDILNNQQKAIDIAKKLTEDNASKMRQYLSAMFYALRPDNDQKATVLYHEFQKYKSDFKRN